MELLQSMLKGKKLVKGPSESYDAQIEEENDKFNKTEPEFSLDQKLQIKKQDPLFLPIHTLLNLRRIQRTKKRPRTLKQFKQNISPQKTQKQKTRTITPFIEPQFFVKTLFQEHSLSIKINQVKYFSATKKGLRNFQTLQNQDVIMTERIANIFKIFAIFDGHGQHGKTVASSCAGYLKSTFLIKKDCLKSYQQEFKRQISQKQIVCIVKNCIKKTQAYLFNFKFNQIQYSGTTALIVMVTPRSIISFNIGNSRLLIGMRQQNDKKIYDFQVTHDHDLNRLDERIRVKEKGAVISPLKDQLGQSFGPDRLWNVNQKRPGTFITRALGLACGSKSGIICEPQVSILKYNKRMKFLVLASDGLWGVQQNDEVIAYLERYYMQGQLGMGVPSLIEEASKRWKQKLQLMDDVTVIAVNLTQIT